MRTCGAKSRRTGRPCQAPAMANGRCRMHGGTNPGAPAGNQRAVKHGIYARFYTEEEQATLDAMQLGDVDAELKLCRIRLMRALAAAQEHEGKPELHEMVAVTGRGKDGGITGEKRYKRTDYGHIIDRLLGRIESLERTRSELLRQVASDDDAPIARIEVEVVGRANAAPTND